MRPRSSTTTGCGSRVRRQGSRSSSLRSRNAGAWRLGRRFMRMFPTRCGSISDARLVFDSIEKNRTVVSWNAMIMGCAENSQSELALKLFGGMQAAGFVPNRVTYIAALKACANLASAAEARKFDPELVKSDFLERGRALHFQAAEMGYDDHVSLANTLVDFYCKCGSVADAQLVFDKMKDHTVVSWTALISGYAEADQGDTALELFSKMQEDDRLRPNYVTYLAALKACVGSANGKNSDELSSLKKARSLHFLVLKDGFEVEGFLANALVDIYGKLRSMKHARSVFDRLQRLDVVSWNALVLGYAECGEEELALESYRRMGDEGCFRNRVTYLAALKACVGLAGKESSRQFCGKAVTKVGCLEIGRAIHYEVLQSGHDLDSFVASTLVDMYSKCGSLVEARSVFDKIKMSDRDVVSWTALILGYAESGEGELAMEFFARMQDEGGRIPNYVTYIAALKACGSVGALQTGKEVHDRIRNAGLEKEPLVASALIDFYGRCGSVIDAEEVFSSSSRKDLVLWNSLFAAYSRQGDVQRVLSLFERMQKEDRLQPDGVSFISILAACSHAGLVKTGKEFFRAMFAEFGIAPGAGHFSCMVDLLGRANHLDEAVAMLRSMPLRPDLSMWIALLAACRKWSNVEIGKLAFESVLSLDEGNAGAYLSMAEIYASVGMWKESRSVQERWKAQTAS